VTERALEALVLSRAETVPRDVEILNSEQLNRAFLLGSSADIDWTRRAGVTHRGRKRHGTGKDYVKRL
jgi:hypothetical protein